MLSADQIEAFLEYSGGLPEDERMASRVTSEIKKTDRFEGDDLGDQRVAQPARRAVPSSRMQNFFVAATMPERV